MRHTLVSAMLTLTQSTTCNSNTSNPFKPSIGWSIPQPRAIKKSSG
jgi:hypothetical protein